MKLESLKTISPHSQVRTMIIDTLTRSDSGSYKCEAVDESGEVHTKLVVLGKKVMQYTSSHAWHLKEYLLRSKSCWCKMRDGITSIFQKWMALIIMCTFN